MFPCFPFNDAGNSVFFQPELSSKCSYSCTVERTFSNEAYQADGSLGVVASLSKTLSLFCLHVVHIVLASAEKQMLWPNACFHVTAMKNPIVIGYFTIIEYPRNTMRRRILTTKKEMSIAAGHLTSNPQPARVLRFVNFLVKTVVIILCQFCNHIYRPLMSLGFLSQYGLPHFGQRTGLTGARGHQT